jgi:hypothetical protein
MDLRGTAVGEGALAMLAENEAAIFEIAQGQANGYAADLKTTTELVLTRDRKRVRFRTAEDFLGEGGDETGTSCRAAELDHARYNERLSLKKQVK